jgi:hypothetical protein
MIKNRLNYLIDKSRLYDISLVDPTGGLKTYVYLYKISSNERALLNIFPFYNINQIPILSLQSSIVAKSLTENFDLIRLAPNPPGILTFNYPMNINIYRPIQPVPVLVPVVRYSRSTNESNKPLFIEKEKPLDIVQRISPRRLEEIKKESPKIAAKVRSFGDLQSE